MATYNNVKITKGSSTVFIATTRVSETYNNSVKYIKYPTTSSTPQTVGSLNLNKFEDRFTIYGHLIYGQITEGETTETWTTAKDKKDGLKEMINNRETVNMTYEGTVYEITIDKYEIDDRARDNTDSKDGEIVYDVTLSGVISDDIF